MRPVADTATIDRAFPLLGAVRRGPGGGWWAGLRHGLAFGAAFVWVLVAVTIALMAMAGRIDVWTFALSLGGSSLVLLGAAAALGDWLGWLRARAHKREGADRFTTGALRPGVVHQTLFAVAGTTERRVFDYSYGDDTDLTCASFARCSGSRRRVRRDSDDRLERAIVRRAHPGRTWTSTGFPAFSPTLRRCRRLLNATVRAALPPRRPISVLTTPTDLIFCTARPVSTR